MLNTVVSVGCTRLFNGIGRGAGRPARLAIVVVVVLERLTSCASGSVPVFTDQRSTPHVAATTTTPPTGSHDKTRPRATASTTARRRRSTARLATRGCIGTRLPIAHPAALN